MPRTENKNTYHYKAEYKNEYPDSPSFTLHFKTSKEACEFFGIGSSSFFDYIKKPLTDRITKNGYKIQKIHKLEKPLPVYEKVLVSFD